MSVEFKLECLQPSGSFKDRGISHMITTLLTRQDVTKIICSSGGNAGHAVATAGQVLSIPVDVYVPVTTLPMMIEKLKKKGAKVFVGGANWNEADAQARLALSQTTGSIFIPPYDDPLIWEGNSTIVDELVNASPAAPPPDAIVVSVGGGGLLAGIQQGVKRAEWDRHTTIFAVETTGAASFAAAKAAGRVVKLGKISTIASSLGALSVTEAVLPTSSGRSSGFNSGLMTESIVVSDHDALNACLQFVEEQRILTEPACGAALAAVASPHREILLKTLLENNTRPTHQKAHQRGNTPWRVVVVVCGGSIVNVDLVAKWRAMVANT